MPYIVKVLGKQETYLTNENTLSTNVKDAVWFATEMNAWDAIDGYPKFLNVNKVKIIKIPKEEKDADAEE